MLERARMNQTGIMMLYRAGLDLHEATKAARTISRSASYQRAKYKVAGAW